ncbi:hypothetical protein [Paenibacillus sp. PL2-23]|uniref:hypothetical protein n=1 Tax=Paenibacillus sp. PL2-23 TaxID=2100729 RepID=UPI0030F8D241
MENQNHKGNYKGTTNMRAKNQDMAFVNDTIEDAKSVSNFSGKKKKENGLQLLTASNRSLGR